MKKKVFKINLEVEATAIFPAADEKSAQKMVNRMIGRGAPRDCLLTVTRVVAATSNFEQLFKEPEPQRY